MLKSCIGRWNGLLRHHTRRAVKCTSYMAMLMLVGSGFATAQSQQPLLGQQYSQPQYPQVNPAQLRPIEIQQTQLIGTEPGEDPNDPPKPLPHQIESMPQIQANMEVIHHRSQLMTTRKNISRIAIADSSVLDVIQYRANELMILGSAIGSTTMTLWFEGDESNPLIYLVKTIRDPSLDEQRDRDYGNLERKLAIYFPNSRVHLIPLSRKVIVKGQAHDPEEAARILQVIRGELINQFGDIYGPNGRGNGGYGGTGDAVRDIYTGNNGDDDFYSGLIINMLEVPGEYQIMLRVRIAELKRAQLRQLGVDISNLLNNGRHSVSTSLGNTTGTFTGIFENGEINVVVNALDSNGTMKVIQEPAITVLSGHPASLLSGGEFAVPTIVGIGGAQGQTTTFRGFGTSLIVVPTVMHKDLIRLQIAPEFSQVSGDNNVGGIPGLNTRRLQTTVELREGQTIVLGGLVGSLSNTEVSRIPFLGDLPFVGRKMFHTKRATLDQTELLILVTPELVRPMEPDEVPPLPGHEVTHPDEHELFCYGMTEGSPDTGVYQIPPYGRGSGHGHNVGYHIFEPSPASPMYSPTVTGPQPGVANGYNGQAIPQETTMPYQHQMQQQYPAMPQQQTMPTGPTMQPTPLPNSVPTAPQPQRTPMMQSPQSFPPQLQPKSFPTSPTTQGQQSSASNPLWVPTSSTQSGSNSLSQRLFGTDSSKNIQTGYQTENQPAQNNVGKKSWFRFGRKQ